MTFSFFLLYNIIRIPLFVLAGMAGFFNAKIRKTIFGRRGLFDQLDVSLEHVPPSAKRIWMHMSSMGEFEQGLPLIDELSKRYPQCWIVISLFSPSAYKNLVYRQERTILTYLPFDSLGHVKRFLEKIRPAIQIIIRHDIWPNYQYILQKRHIPSVLVNASISDKRLSSSRRFCRLYRQVYETFAAICAVSEVQKGRLVPIYPRAENIFVCGDTRYDRVYERALDTKKIGYLLQSDHFRHEKCFIAGSSWPADEKIIVPAVLEALSRFDEFSVIIAPHEIDREHLEFIEHLLSQAGFPCVRLSEFHSTLDRIRILLIDSFGLLANLYALGGIAYIGGGFGVGVHSVLEPAAHAAAVSYGPNHLNSPEAKEMTTAAIGVPIANEKEFRDFLFEMLQNPALLAERGQKAKEYVMRNVGASQRTAAALHQFIDCT
jgi:3-deoxy-D-manno-octulosonic-acid transferase